MTMNPVQLQQGLPMAQFIQKYGTEAKYYRALYRSRWSHGFRCPRRSQRLRSRFRRADRVHYQHRACRPQTTLTGGSVFEDSRLSLTAWFLATHLLAANKVNLSVLELERDLGVCYGTTCKLKHKIVQAMAEREGPRELKSFMQIDDAYPGGERNGGKLGRGSENKQPFAVAISTDEALEHSTFVVIETVRRLGGVSLTDWSKRRIAPDAEVLSDGPSCFCRFVKLNHTHTVLETERGCAATGVKDARWVNTVMATGNLSSAAATTPCAKPSMRGATSPKRRTGSIGALASLRCCPDSCVPWSCANLGQSQNCAPSTVFMAERSRQ